jgi:protease IV
MALDSDHVLDRRRLKRHLTFWRVGAIVLLVALIVAVVGRLQGWTDGGYIARFTVARLIVDDPDRDKALAIIAEDDDAKALIVRIDSPGGTVVGGEALYLSLRRVAGNKPVVAVMGQVAASAAYMTALGADRVVARSGSLTGSIGVLLQTADITGLLEKIGVKPETIKSGPLKAQPNPLEPFTPEAREATRAVVGDVFEMFVDMVAERRNLPRDEVVKLADGRIFTGRQAIANGLIDALGGEPEARQWLAEKPDIPATLPVKDVRIERDDGAWRELIGETIGKTLVSELLRLDGLISVWHPEAW